MERAGSGIGSLSLAACCGDGSTGSSVDQYVGTSAPPSERDVDGAGGAGSASSAGASSGQDADAVQRVGSGTGLGRPSELARIPPPLPALLAAVQRPVALLGKGASGRVYSVALLAANASWVQGEDDGGLGALVHRAVKEVALSNPDVLQREVHGATIQASIKHANILPVEALFRDRFNLYIVLPLADLSLEAFIAMSRALSAPLALDFGAQIAAGMRHLHHGLERPVTHRDLKPQNVLLFRRQRRYQLRLCDFGISRHVDTAKSVRGTLIYMPPETFSNYVPAKADVWAFALICMEMLTGTKPHNGVLIADEDLASGRPYPEDAFERAPPPLRPILQACLRTDPQSRPDFCAIHDAFRAACQPIH